METQTVRIPVSKHKDVSAILNIPEDYSGDSGIIIAHGAGNDMSHPMLAHLAEGLAGAGHLCLRFNFLYREEEKKAPDSYDVLCAVWNGAHQFLQGHSEYASRLIVAAGKSLGGRIASQMTAEDRLTIEKLIFLGYPLHAPGKKDRLRDEHLYRIPVPMLFFAGTRDPLCDLELLREVLPRLKAPWDLEVIEGGDHSFNVPKSYGIDQVDIYQRILKKVLAWLEYPS